MRWPIKGLGEIALRVNDLDAMLRFYQDVIGLELMERSENAVFFRIAEGYGGHTQVLVLFDRSEQPGYAGLNPTTTTVDHIAFEIDLADFESEKQRLEQLGVAVSTAEHAWVHWRSLYVTDPEGHTVELVCYDPSVTDG
jgi:catechol 2,3-dioxygenase